MTMTMAMTESKAEPQESHDDEHHCYYRYTTVTGYFLQDDPSTDPAGFDFAATSLGLIDRGYDTDDADDNTDDADDNTDDDDDNNNDKTTIRKGDATTQWQRFGKKVKSLNQTAATTGTRYILVYAGRHGEGWHNRAVDKYGTQAWDCYWSTLDGDEDMSWADAKLTDVGLAQASAVNAFWRREIRLRSILTPQRFFVSPLDRCLRTAQLSWDGLDLADTGDGGGGQVFDRAEVKEMLRECIGIHTCDRRSTRPYISSTYPYRIEPGFAEEDPLWVPDLRESDTALTKRLKLCLDDIVRGDEQSTVFSLTTHGGALQALLRAVGHRRFALSTGSVIPLFIKAELIRGPEPEMPVDPWQPKPPC